MTRQVVTVADTTPIAATAQLLDAGIKRVPVMWDGKLVGEANALLIYPVEACVGYPAIKRVTPG